MWLSLEESIVPESSDSTKSYKNRESFCLWLYNITLGARVFLYTSIYQNIE